MIDYKYRDKDEMSFVNPIPDNDYRVLYREALVKKLRIIKTKLETYMKEKGLESKSIGINRFEWAQSFDLDEHDRTQQDFASAAST